MRLERFPLTTMKLNWRSITISSGELSLNRVLRCGQTFRWKQNAGVFSMAMKGRVFFLQQQEEQIHYATLEGSEDDLVILEDYFNLSIELKTLYESWAVKDAKFIKHTESLGGIRILRQDPWENLCSFICSSNNNIKRISLMVENLCKHFGPLIATYDGIDYHDFPSPEKLAAPGVEQILRSLGFGYRAKYLHKTALLVQEQGLETLHGLRKLPYKECHESLLQYTGVGPKVADCVCLMSLDKHDCVPVDTHVWQIAQRDYKFGRKHKALNKIAYGEIGDFFRELWGPYAGWAQSVVFTADLKDLNNGVNVKQVETLIAVKREADELESVETSRLVKKIAA